MAQTHKQYKKAVKKLGAKQIATPAEFEKIQQAFGRKRIYRRIRERTARRAALRDAKPTVRTKSIEKRLERAGLTQRERDRLRGIGQK